jgi:hypothetical protein
MGIKEMCFRPTHERAMLSAREGESAELRDPDEHTDRCHDLKPCLSQWHIAPS